MIFIAPTSKSKRCNYCRLARSRGSNNINWTASVTFRSWETRWRLHDRPLLDDVISLTTAGGHESSGFLSAKFPALCTRNESRRWRLASCQLGLARWLRRLVKPASPLLASFHSSSLLYRDFDSFASFASPQCKLLFTWERSTALYDPSLRLS